MIGRWLAATRNRFGVPAVSTGDNDVAAHAARLTVRYGDADARSLLETMIGREFAGRIAVVSSFGTQSAVLLDLVARADPATPVIFLASGKHFPDTLAYADTLTRRLGLEDVSHIAPDPLDLADEDAGGRLWRTHPDLCCHIRKVLPLQRALIGFAPGSMGASDSMAVPGARSRPSKPRAAGSSSTPWRAGARPT